MKRKGLKLQLALAIDATLGFQHGISIVNAKRYVNDKVRAFYRIRYGTKIELEDWIIAVQAVRVDRVGHFVRQSKSYNAPLEERLVNIIDSIQISSNQNKSSSPYV